MDSKISRDQAEAEITAWLDKKKVFAETRDRYKDHIDILIEAMCNGALRLDDTTFEFTHTLLFPLGENGSGLKEFKYKARINDKQIQPYMKGVKADDADGRLGALIAAICDQPKGVISVIDSADKRIATAIGIFFM